MSVYTPQQLAIKPPAGGFQDLGWYSGRQYKNGTLSEPGVIHPESSQVGAGQAVSAEVNAQSAQAQGVSAPQLESYLQTQRQQPVNNAPAPVAPAPAKIATPSTTTPGGATAGGTGLTTTPNLPDIYKNLYSTSGISDLENQYSEMSKQYTEAKGKVNDNPFLSEATRVGRVAKLEQLFNERTANTKNDIATKKADIETQLNLQTKQFDINSQQAQQALSQFNTLLSMGALTGAKGEDIANLTRSTGISSDMIYSAIDTQKKKDIKTATINFDDGINQGFAIINSDTGEIIKKQVVADSKPKTTTTGASTFGSKEFNATANSALQQFVASRLNKDGDINSADWKLALNAFLGDGLGSSITDFVKQYGIYADTNLNKKAFIQSYGFAKPK